MSFLKSKKANTKTKCTVFGFVREYLKKHSLNIPMMIQYLFITYYWIDEHFTSIGKNTVLVTNRIARINVHGKHIKYNTVYGNDVINIKDKSISKYEWIFELVNPEIKYNAKFPICIGLDSSNNKYINTLFCSSRFDKDKYKKYGCWSNGFLNGYDHVNPIMVQRTFADEWKDGDIICMALDVKEKKLKYSINGVKCMNIKIDLKNQEYNLAVALSPAHQNTIEIIDFNVYH